jgi:hypothetical protein
LKTKKIKLLRDLSKLFLCEAREASSSNIGDTPEAARLLNISFQFYHQLQRVKVPRPAPLSDAAKKARAPTPPEELVAARQDRVHVEKGKLIAAVPLKVTKQK